ncbi:MAG: hypothetical protein ABSG90_02060 [Dehalococcoidia bacterium]
MKCIVAAKMSAAAAILMFLIAGTGCGSYGGADIYLENVNIGSVSMEGKPVTGLPTQNVNIVLKTNSNKVMESQSNGKTTLKLQPSGAVVTSGPDGISFTGVDSSQVEIVWQGTTQ